MGRAKKFIDGLREIKDAAVRDTPGHGGDFLDQQRQHEAEMLKLTGKRRPSMREITNAQNKLSKQKAKADRKRRGV